MVGSNADGEALNAARLADRLVRDTGITWPDVLAVPAPTASQSFDVLADGPLHRRAALHVCERAPATLQSPWERQFCANLSRYRHRPSSPQLDILASVAARVLAEAPHERHQQRRPTVRGWLVMTAGMNAPWPGTLTVFRTIDAQKRATKQWTWCSDRGWCCTSYAAGRWFFPEERPIASLAT
jgi:hypothetical protein